MQSSFRAMLGRGAWVGLSVLMCACGGSAKPAATTDETAATSRVEVASRAALTEASSAVHFSGSALTIRRATASSNNVSCGASTCTFTAYPVLEDKATVDGTVDSSTNLNLKISFSSYLGITGTVNASGNPNDQLHVTFDVTVDSTAYTSDYQLGSDGTRSGTINGHRFKAASSSSSADASVSARDAATGTTNVFTNCGTSNSTGCQAVVCAYKQYYDNCTSKSGISSSVCAHIIDCTDQYISCICTNNAVDQSKVQGCVSTYVSCAQIQQ